MQLSPSPAEMNDLKLYIGSNMVKRKEGGKRKGGRVGGREGGQEGGKEMGGPQL